jgi:hypothetical protein
VHEPHNGATETGFRQATLSRGPLAAAGRADTAVAALLRDKAVMIGGRLTLFTLSSREGAGAERVTEKEVISERTGLNT